MAQENLGLTDCLISVFISAVTCATYRWERLRLCRRWLTWFSTLNSRTIIWKIQHHYDYIGTRSLCSLTFISLCALQSTKKSCSFLGCTNQSMTGGVCIRHGAKKKLCSFLECTNQAVNGGVCIRRRAEKKLCIIPECTNQAQKGGECRRHGAER